MDSSPKELQTEVVCLKYLFHPVTNKVSYAKFTQLGFDRFYILDSPSELFSSTKWVLGSPKYRIFIKLFRELTA